MADKLMQTVMDIVNVSAESTLAHNNANKDSTRIPTMRDMVAGEVSKKYALENILPKHVAEAHISGDIHYHDLDYSPLFPMYNCMLIDLEEMLSKGFKMGNADIEPPRSISTACAVTAQIIAQVASHIYGGNSINRIDEILAPYVRKSYSKWLSTGRQFIENEAKAVIFAEKMTVKETHDAFQSLEYEINTLHTANGQTPFTTLGFGLGDSWESRLIQESIFKVRQAGLGKHKTTAIFPKLVFCIKEGLNRSPMDINYPIKRMALECAARRMYPDILNYEKLVDVTGSFKTPMGCRSFLGPYYTEEGKLEHSGRNNLGVVTLNIPRIAFESNGDINKFYNILDRKMGVVRDALETRIDRLRGVKAKVAPILYCEGACGVRLDPEDDIFPIFENGRASISVGYIGLHETATLMFPDEPHTFESSKKKEFAVGVVAKLREYVDSWKKETGFGYSLYSTPSESLCDRFCRLDEAKYGCVEAITDKGYYTNSFHLDVFKKVSPNDKIDFEEEYPQFASGGFISYTELPQMVNFIDALEWVWDYTYYKIPYFGTNTPIDECHECGFKGDCEASEDGYKCPSCGNNNPETLDVTKRVCGYLGAPKSRPFNRGKQLEVMGRVKHHRKLN